MKKTTLLLLSLFAVLLLGGCSKSSVSGSEPFVVSTPDVGRLTTVSHPSFYETGNGLIDAISFIGGKKVDDSVMLSLSFDDHLSTGEDLKIDRCYFGLHFSSIGTDSTDRIASGRILLKEQSERRIVIRFIDLVFKTGRGDYRLNGDLTFKKADAEVGL